MRKREKDVLDALARYTSAHWEEGPGPPDAYLVVAGERVGVDLAPWREGLPQLRFDRVALKFVDRLQTSLHAAVPEGETVILAVTAPLRLAGKTAGVLEGMIRTWLAQPRRSAELRGTINGNRVCVRLASGRAAGAPAVIGFVHSAGSGPDILLQLTAALLARIRAPERQTVINR